MVLVHMDDGTRRVVILRRMDWVMGEGLADGIKLVDNGITANPQSPRAVFDQAVDVHAAETIRSPRLMLEHLELITVITVQSILRWEPDKPKIVLHR